MDTMVAWLLGDANRGKELMVFDWEKAARLIKEKKPKYASAGLRDDWEWTGGTIYANGKPVKGEYTYLSSTWAVPELCMDGELYECYKMQHEVPRWGCGTKWPAVAMRILKDMDK